ncbi:MAG: NusG domain II-containing protein [Lachnospiraceae bacterium]|nr:NusG domain II-containing protein [Lachnospiraceae bacterium]
MKNPWKGILLLFIIALFLFSLIWSIFILSSLHNEPSGAVIADIYQDGELLYSIRLSQITEGSTLKICGANGATNIIGLEPGRIGMLEATCPDKLCVKQGFYSSPTLPITCLPNKVVIQLRRENVGFFSPQQDTITPDIITY